MVLLRQTLLGLLLGSVMCFCTLASAANTCPTKAPEEFLRCFYAWYLADVQADKIPIADDRQKLKKYVAGETIRRIDKLSKEGEYDADYFLKAQDILDDWPHNVAVSGLEATGTKASATVTLGKTSTWRLKVFMGSVKGSWRIERVEGLNRKAD